MPPIVFRGKTSNSEFEMPEEIRQAYQESQRRETVARPLTDVVDMPDEVKAVYEQARDRVQSALPSQQAGDLPTTEDLYRQSAPQDMRHLPSDESIFRPSPPVIDPENSTIESEPGFVASSMAINFLWVLALIVIIFLVVQFLW